jgi:RNA polymerase-interacting CarD/CdnL/TRCF family regulator
MLDYHIGDTVIHQQFGLGKIIEMDEKVIHNRKTLCYVVRAPNHITLWIPADEPEKSSIRRPTPEGRFEALFDILRSPGTPLPIDRYERKTLLTERLKAGDIASICTVIRDLAQHQRIKKLNDYDKNIYERAQSFLLAEWSYAFTIPHSQANTSLMQLLGISLP